MKGHHPLWGVAAILGTSVCFTVSDLIVRSVGTLVPLLVLLWCRYAVHALIMGCWVAFDRTKSFATANPRFQLLRGTMLVFSTGLVFTGLRYLPVAESTAIVMLSPVLVTLMASVVLKEQVSRLRWALVVCGLLGALVVVRPGSGIFGWPVLFPLGGCFLNAAFQVLSSRMAASESPYTTNFYSGLVGACAITPALWMSSVDIPGLFDTVPTPVLLSVVGVGFSGTLGHLLLTLAFSVAPASTLTPLQYLQIAIAACAGWAVLGAMPDLWSWVGMAIISACGAGSAWLNVREASARRPVSQVSADPIVD